MNKQIIGDVTVETYVKRHAPLRRTALVFLFLEGGGGGNDVLKFCSVGGHDKWDFVSLIKYT